MKATHQRALVEHPETGPAEWPDLQQLRDDAPHDAKQCRRAAESLPSWRAWPDWSAPGDMSEK
eukprot:5826113-Pyramimonas_sp.AAC.1